MSRATFFLRDCPTCGRRLRIRVEYLGRWVRCKHCSGSFEALDPSIHRTPPATADDMLARANALLAGYEEERRRFS